MVKFSEIVYAKEPLSKTGDGRGGKKVKSADTEWINGVWTGRTETSNENIIMTPEGTLRFRTIRRLPESKRYDGEFLKKCRGVPWDDQLGRQRGKPKVTGRQAPGTARFTPPVMPK